MFRYARSIVGSEAAAEDAVQDVFLKLFSGRSGIRNLEALAMTAVRNRSLDMLRREKFRSDGPVPEGMAEERYGEKEMKAMVMEAMERLPQDQREAVHLKDVEGYGTEDVANIMSIKETYVRVLLSRGRRTLRDRIKEIMEYGTEKRNI